MDSVGNLRYLTEITKRILSVCDPERIILFGSYARGDFGPESDLDLLVIEDEEGSYPQEASARIYRALADLVIPVDILVVRKAFVERYGSLVGTVIRPALREGRVIYAR